MQPMGLKVTAIRRLSAMRDDIPAVHQPMKYRNTADVTVPMDDDAKDNGLPKQEDAQEIRSQAEWPICHGTGVQNRPIVKNMSDPTMASHCCRYDPGI